MSLGSTVLLAYGVLMVVGGLMGARAGSRASLMAGTGSGVVLLIAWFVARTHPAVGLWTGAVVSLLLCVTFTIRVRKTGKLMPAGLLLAVSLVACALLLASATRA
jgi:uncharacterized membrane protein (UPF0136 family)